MVYSLTLVRDASLFCFVLSGLKYFSEFVIPDFASEVHFVLGILHLLVKTVYQHLSSLTYPTKCFFCDDHDFENMHFVIETSIDNNTLITKPHAKT
jgi:hypothetical protein